jgi:phosphomevalonate kinase
MQKRYRFEKATLYEREVIKKQQIFIRSQKLPYSYNMWLGNRSLKMRCLRVFQASSVTEVLIHI